MPSLNYPKEFKVGDWVIWAGYVCQITGLTESMAELHAIGFNSCYRMLSVNLYTDSKSITEQEALFLLLKNHKAFVGNI